MTDNDDEPRTRRIVLVLDVKDLTRATAHSRAQTCLQLLHNHLNDRSIDATPIRYDIDGWTYLAPHPRR